MITLFPTYMLGDLRLTSYPYAVEFGGDHGAPETITELVQSLLADGDIVRVSRHGNREISLVVHVEGASLAEVAENEAALRRECAKLRNLLTFEPGDPLGSPASVFEVLVAEMRHPRDDEMEQQLLRRWELTLTGAPHVRSVDLTVAEPLGADVVPETVVVDACGSTAGWTAQPSDTIITGVAEGTASDSYVQAGDGSTDDIVWLARSAAIDVTAHQYFALDWKVRPTSGRPLLSLGAGNPTSSGGVVVPELARFGLTTGSDWFRSWYEVAPGDLDNGFTLTYEGSSASGVSEELSVRQVLVSNIPPGNTPRQMTRIVPVGGTERTPGSLEVSAVSGSLGMTIVHTSPEDGSGYSPALRQWRTDGNTVTADATLLSGAREPLSPAVFRARVPIASVPEGGYLLAARMRSTAAGAVLINWSTSTTFDEATTLGEAYVLDDSRVEFAAANTWQFVPLGVLSLPSVRASSGFVRINIHHQAGAPPTVDMDEAWLFRVDDDCALTVVDNVTETRAWLDSPSLASRVPRVSVGNAEDRSDSRHPAARMVAQGSHVFAPPGTRAFVATGGTDHPVVRLSHYARWHSNAAS